MATYYISNEGIDNGTGVDWEHALNYLVAGIHDRYVNGTFNISAPIALGGSTTGDVVARISAIGATNFTTTQGASFENLEILGFSGIYSLIAAQTFTYCKLINIAASGTYSSVTGVQFVDSTLVNCGTSSRFFTKYLVRMSTILSSNLSLDLASTAGAALDNCCVVNSSLEFNGDPSAINYSYFLNTSMQFKGGSGSDIVSIPRFKTKSEAAIAGANQVTESLEGKVEAEWGATIAGNAFQNAVVDDNVVYSDSDVFIDVNTLDLRIKHTSNAYDSGAAGVPAGVTHVNSQLNLNLGISDFTKVNIDGSGNLINADLEGVATSNIIPLNAGTLAVLKRIYIESRGVNNSDFYSAVNSTPSLDTSTVLVAGDTLVVGTKYHNYAEGVSISLSGTGRVITPGENFIAEATETGFIGSSSVCEIRQNSGGEFRNKLSIGIKCSREYSTLSDFNAHVTEFNYEYSSEKDILANVDINNAILAGSADSGYIDANASNVVTRYVQLIVKITPYNIRP